MTPDRPRGGAAVMQRRIEPPDSLDYFPTPPWATRAMLPFLRELDPDLGSTFVWEPACGEGHMAAVLEEAFRGVMASDVFDYGYGEVQDFLAHDSAYRPGWVVTNPPFKTAAEFAELGLKIADRGVALLVRTAWLEGGDRYERLFSKRPPALVLQYAERVAMTKGRWEPDASTATSYCWVIWRHGEYRTRFAWIPPGRKRALTKPEDIDRFAVKTAAPLLDGGAG